ncbi:MAG: dephospho-CoA kinase [Dehalococcoidia bacterium]|jgi:dephospho-CoA kinase|nr:dephospho-CoA kinase [Dehalococcoidia bacterium]
MPMILGVTGSIATGKSGMCQHIVDTYGATHGDADKIVHRMFDPGRDGFDNAVAEFGEDIIGEDGYIDRKKIGNLVFGNPENMGRWMKAIGNIEDEMRTTVENWRATLGDDDVAILEAVNLIEADYSAWCDATWLVAAEDAIALPRLIARNAFSEEEAQQRLGAQRKWTDRAAAADHIFHNDGSYEDFIAEVDQTFRETKEQHSAGTLAKSVWFAWREANPKPDATQS